MAPSTPYTAVADASLSTDGCNGCDIDRLDFTLDAIDKDERLGVLVPCSRAADVDTGVFLARLSCGCDGGDTWQVTSQGRADTSDTCGTFKHFASGLGDSSHHRGFLLLTVSHNYDFFQLVVFFKRNLDVSLFSDFGLLCRHAYVGEHQHRLFGGYCQLEVTVDISYRSQGTLSFYYYRRSDQGLTGVVCDCTPYIDVALCI